MIRTSLAVRAVAAASLLAGSFVLAGAQTAQADTVCVGDKCDDGRWQAARGQWNENGYWNMFAGHNCTNYVAWRLWEQGVPEPAISLGNAADWADRAVENGYTVDEIPSVGAVAQWDSYAAGYGVDGHVAYVEQVNSDGTVEVSEDYWYGGSQTGQLTYRTMPASSVSHYIHLHDESTWLRVATTPAATPVDATATTGAAVAPTGHWDQNSTGLDPNPDLMAGVAVAGTPTVFWVQDGKLIEATGSTAGTDGSSGAPGAWTTTDTGLVSTSTSLAALELGGSPYVMSVEDGSLIMDVDTGGGWQRMPTGVDQVAGDIAAVDDGNLLPTVMLSQDGLLYEAWGDADGWHLVSTGLAVSGAISAVDLEARLEVFSLDDGQLVHSYWNGSGWEQDVTQILADKVVAAVSVAGVTHVILERGADLVELTPYGGSWNQTLADVPAGTVTTAVASDTAPVLVQWGPPKKR